MPRPAAGMTALVTSALALAVVSAMLRTLAACRRKPWTALTMMRSRCGHARVALRRRAGRARRQKANDPRTRRRGARRSATRCSRCRRSRWPGRWPRTCRSGTEPDTRGLVYALWKRGTYVLLPLLRPDDDLDWASYEGPDSLAAGAARAARADRAAARRAGGDQRRPGDRAGAGGGPRRHAAGPGRRLVRPGAGPGRRGRCPPSRCSTTTSCSTRFRPARLTSRCAWWPGRGKESPGCASCCYHLAVARGEC